MLNDGYVRVYVDLTGLGYAIKGMETAFWNLGCEYIYMHRLLQYIWCWKMHGHLPH
jgi:hypothetical protein